MAGDWCNDLPRLRPTIRLAAPGRRVGGIRDWSPSIPHPDVMLPLLQQASFSVTSDGRFAAVAGSRAVAVWDVAACRLLWRDDSLHYTPPGAQNVRIGPLELAPSFPQLKPSPDGKALALHHDGTTIVRDGRTAFVPSPPAWEFTWQEPVTLNTVAVYESTDHPEAVPEEVRIEAWVRGTLKVVRHEFWNAGVVHRHRFDAVTTTRLRYTPLGDLARNVWLAGIEIFFVSP